MDNNVERIENDIHRNHLSSKPLATVENYWQEYTKINQKIAALEVQIKVLTECAERYHTDSLETSLHLACYDLSLRKREISPIIAIISRSIPHLCPDVDGNIIYERLFLGRPLYEIAHDHKVSESYVTRNVNTFLRVSVPSEILDEILNK